MSKPISQDYDFQSVNRLLNLPASTANGQAVVHEQLLAAIEGRSDKDNVRVRTASNINLAAPGANLDGLAMSVGDRWLAAGQTLPPENGLYIWTGAATPATRAPDASTADELESAIVAVDEGTSAGTSWRQTTVNFVLGTGNIVWVPFGAGPSASETISGSMEIADQPEADLANDDLRAMTPKKVRNLSYLTITKKFTIGDATATSHTIAHNFATKDVGVLVREATGLERDMDCEINRNTASPFNTVIVKATPAIALNGAIVYVTRLGIVT
jgi:hypothetical protein